MTVTDDRLPPAPRTLSTASRRVWRDVVSTWVLDPTGLLLLRAGLERWDLYQRARDELATADSVTVVTGDGMTRAHPAAKVANDALREARQCFRQLGLEMPDPGAAERRRVLGRRGGLAVA